MKIPNLASLYQVGTSHWDREPQSGRNGPSCPTLSTSFSMTSRAGSYFATELFHCCAMPSAGRLAVGATEDAVCAGIHAVLQARAVKAMPVSKRWPSLRFLLNIDASPESDGVVALANTFRFAQAIDTTQCRRLDSGCGNGFSAAAIRWRSSMLFRVECLFLTFQSTFT